MSTAYGKTHEMLCSALALAREGKRIVIIVHDHRFVGHCTGILRTLGADRETLACITFLASSIPDDIHKVCGRSFDQVLVDHTARTFAATWELEQSARSRVQARSTAPDSRR